MLATFATLLAYDAAIVPRAHRQIIGRARTAAAIPDPLLRGHASETIAVDTDNAVAVAALAATAPLRRRRATVELLVAYQLLVDYVDRLGERACAGQVRRSLRLGAALAAVAAPAGAIAIDSLGEDGGYLGALVATCRKRLGRLPAHPLIQLDARRAAERCAHALAHTHAAAHRGSVDDLRRWVATQRAPGGYAWWELAAGANSNLAITALLAAAADPALTRREAAAIAAAYWPHVCVMSTLLDSLVDYEQDIASGNFSFVSHYADRDAIRRGVIRAATNSLAATQTLPHRHTHAMIVCGVAAYYATGATEGTLGAEIAPPLLAALEPLVKPIALALRAQRRLQRTPPAPDAGAAARQGGPAGPARTGASGATAGG